MNATARRERLPREETPKPVQAEPERVRIVLTSDWYLSQTRPHVLLTDVLLHILDPKTGRPATVTETPKGGRAVANPIVLSRADRPPELYAPVPYRARLTHKDGTEIYSWIVTGEKKR